VAEERTLDTLNADLTRSGKMLNDCANAMKELGLLPRANIRHIAEALVAIFEIQSDIYKQRPDLMPEYLKAEPVGTIYESWGVYRESPDLRVPIDAANEKSRRLRELVLAPEILVMPGAWDPLSAILFERLGFKAIQGSSAAIAAVLGYRDGEIVQRGATTHATGMIAAAVSVPVNADGEAGYGAADDTADTVHHMVRSGAAGMNLEDSIPSGPTAAGRALAPVPDHLEKIAAVMEAKRALASEFFLNARVDAFMAIENPNEALNESIRRGNEYAALGADCVFYIRAGNSETIRTLVREVKAPVSILAGPTSPSVRELDELGVARVSYGTSFFTQALAGVKALADIVLAKGDPGDQLTKGFPHAQLNEFLRGKGG
jgi:2-methylisocitrate lyase-like PEP mutase family enzyme